MVGVVVKQAKQPGYTAGAFDVGSSFSHANPSRIKTMNDKQKQSMLARVQHNASSAWHRHEMLRNAMNAA